LGTNVDYTKIREERRWHRTLVKKKYAKSSTVVIIGHQKRKMTPFFRWRSKTNLLKIKKEDNLTNVVMDEFISSVSAIIGWSKKGHSSNYRKSKNEENSTLFAEKDEERRRVDGWCKTNKTRTKRWLRDSSEEQNSPTTGEENIIHRFQGRGFICSRKERRWLLGYNETNKERRSISWRKKSKKEDDSPIPGEKRIHHRLQRKLKKEDSSATWEVEERRRFSGSRGEEDSSGAAEIKKKSSVPGDAEERRLIGSGRSRKKKNPRLRGEVDQGRGLIGYRRSWRKKINCREKSTKENDSSVPRKKMIHRLQTKLKKEGSSTANEVEERRFVGWGTKLKKEDLSATDEVERRLIGCSEKSTIHRF
jgi:hypothetical protein